MRAASWRDLRDRAGLRARLRAQPPPSRSRRRSTTRSAGPSEQIQGVSANIKLTDHLLEGASLATGGAAAIAGGELASSPLITGASGPAVDRKRRRPAPGAQSQKGDTQVVYDGHTVTLYDAA